MIKPLLLFLLGLTLSLASSTSAQQTFCNPLNLNYGLRKKSDQPSRHGADPVVVLWKNRYYLFSTWDLPGYRVSDDLLEWKYIPFTAPAELVGPTYTAAAVAQVGDWLYYAPFGTAKALVKLYRTKDPESGKWETVGPLEPYSDPCLFVDPPTKKLYMAYGLSKPLHVVELDPETAKEIPGTNTQVMEKFDPEKPIENGWEVCTNDNNVASPPMRGTGTYFPCREGSWMTFHDGKYLLQFASPGTTIPGYSDGLLIGTSPLGPFTYSQESPISQKDSGFITSAGHSCMFQDRYGNWWRAVTMLIGVHERFERRIGLFPAGFDKNGIPFTRTELGDLPITMPTGPRDQSSERLGDVYAGWFVISDGKPITASSSLDDHPPTMANDENIRTRWSAKSGGADEWLQIDLQQSCEVKAAQINLAEQDCVELKDLAQDYHRFTLAASEDGKTWTTVVDRHENTIASPHTYVPFDKPVHARYFKLSNLYTPASGKFSVSDLRLFGVADGSAPTTVSKVSAERDAKDRRKVTIKWKPVSGASAYLIRYGLAKDDLNHHYLVRGGDKAEWTLYSLNGKPGYTFRIDAMNDSGVTKGSGFADAP